MAKKWIQDETPLGAEVDMMPLYVTHAQAEALGRLRAALQANPGWYRHVRLKLEQWQKHKDGPLTDVLAALVE